MRGSARLLRPQPLTREAFAPFGEVIETEGAQSFIINRGTTRRFHELARVDVASESGRPIVSIFLGDGQPAPIRLTLMERHPLGSQAFFPLEARDWLLVVSESADPTEFAALRAFRASGRQGVNYARGAWHHPLLVPGAAASFLVVDRAGDGFNLEERLFAVGAPVFLEG